MDNQDETTTTANQPQGESTGASTETPELAGKHIAELLSQAENAYTMYRQAQKEVARGYKKQEEQIEKAFKAAEKKATEECARALEKAAKAREQVERYAEEVFRKAVDKAREEYDRAVVQALNTRDETIAEEWQKFSSTRQQAWAIFQGEKPSG